MLWNPIQHTVSRMFRLYLNNCSHALPNIG
nr:MAG TPA: hypothetical protein [Caudoviricetes sp.]